MATGCPDFVPVAERIATFDNDGTLWSEQPTYVQVAFALDRIRVLSGTAPRMGGEAAVQGGPGTGLEDDHGGFAA